MKFRLPLVAATLLLNLTVLAYAAPAAPQQPAPFSLSDPDGQELILESMSVRAAVEGMLSLTEIEFRFRNPKNVVAEGRFVATLPPDASVVRFAKEVNGVLVEGEVVERLRANQIYDSYFRPMRDPALLEQDLGNRFSVRVFPINPQESIRLILSYSEILPLQGDRRSYRFPVRGLPRIGRFDFRASFAPLGAGELANDVRAPKGAKSSNVRIVEMEERDYLAEEDIEVSTPEAHLPQRLLIRSGDFLLGRIIAPASPWGAAGWSGRTLLYIDTSASSADGATHRIAAIGALLAAMPPEENITVLSFDQTVQQLAQGPAQQLVKTVPRLLTDRLFIGGTDLAGALNHAGTAMRGDASVRAVFVSDGVPTLGETDASAIKRAAEGVGGPLMFVVIGSRQAPALPRLIADDERLRRVVRMPLAATADDASHAVAELNRPRGATLNIIVDGVEWVHLSNFTDVPQGAERFFFARAKGEPRIAVQGPQPNGFDTMTLPRAAPLLEREAWRHYVNYLGDREAAENDTLVRQAIIAEQTRLAIEHRILTPRTTLLVLESDAEYARFNVDRRALSSILTVGAKGIEVMQRNWVPTVNRTFTPPPPPQAPKRVASGVGTVRLEVSGSSSGNLEVELLGPTRRSIRTSRSGVAEFRSVAGGSYTLRLHVPNAPPMDTRVNLEGGQSATLTVQLAPRGRGTAQVGNIEGRVVNEGIPLPGATLTLRSPDRDEIRGTTVSSATGAFAFRAVAPGSYMVRTEMEGFQTHSAWSTVAAGVTTRLDVNLRLSSIAESITVTASAPAVLETTEVQANVVGDESDDEPLLSLEDAIQETDPRTPPPAPRMLETSAVREKRSGWAVREWRKQHADEALARIRRDPADRFAWVEAADILLALRDGQRLRKLAIDWQPYDPENPHVYEMLGEAALLLGRSEEAQRAFGSLVELAPARTELLQRAGILLARAGNPALGVGALRRAVELRPDRINGHRHLGLVLLMQGEYEQAAEALEHGLRSNFGLRQPNAPRTIGEELAIVYRAWIAKDPSKREAIEARSRQHAVDLARADALRITLAWETDANDVDLHVTDPGGEEVSYDHMRSSSGLELYADVTDGFGPEVVRIGERLRGQYNVGVDYYAAGPMGVARGIIVVATPIAPYVEFIPFRLPANDADRAVQPVATLRVK
jgi:tetratricopeptide (TPR) repeat protein